MWRGSQFIADECYHKTLWWILGIVSIDIFIILIIFAINNFGGGSQGRSGDRNWEIAAVLMDMINGDAWDTIVNCYGEQTRVIKLLMPSKGLYCIAVMLGSFLLAKLSHNTI